VPPWTTQEELILFKSLFKCGRGGGVGLRPKKRALGTVCPALTQWRAPPQAARPEMVGQREWAGLYGAPLEPLTSSAAHAGATALTAGAIAPDNSPKGAGAIAPDNSPKGAGAIAPDNSPKGAERSHGAGGAGAGDAAAGDEEGMAPREGAPPQPPGTPGADAALARLASDLLSGCAARPRPCAERGGRGARGGGSKRG